MLIRWATEDDLPAWYELATEVSEIFQHPADMGEELRSGKRGFGSAGRYEMLTAVDYMSAVNMGFICFSRKDNSITWFAVSEKYRGKRAGDRLLKTALRHLDTDKDITVTTFTADYPQGTAARKLYNRYGFTEEKPTDQNGFPRSLLTRPATSEKRGGSFHHRYTEYIKEAQEETCPVCNDEPSPDGQYPIEINDKVWIMAEYPGQGRLFGKMYVMPVKHTFHFEDMSDDDAEKFISEVRRVGRALRKVTGAIKINYEMHSNSGAHLHIHLFPRYLDDDFPGMAIDVHQKEPAPYETFEEFQWFITRMKDELCPIK